MPLNKQAMTAPNYSKCWKCGKQAIRYSHISARCLDNFCAGNTPQDDTVWVSIHNRLAAVREEATKAERENNARICDDMGDPETAARIRNRE